MKRYIFDTDSFLKKPNIISEWNPSYKLIIPDIVLKEASIQDEKLAKPKILRKLVDRLFHKGFIEIGITNTKEPIYNKEIEEKYNLSFIEFHIAKLAEKYSDENENVYLVTNNENLKSYAEENGVETISYIVFRVLLNNYKKVKLDKLSKNTTLKSYQIKIILGCSIHHS